MKVITVSQLNKLLEKAEVEYDRTTDDQMATIWIVKPKKGKAYRVAVNREYKKGWMR